MMNEMEKYNFMKEYISRYFNHHLISYNYFINCGLKQIIDEDNYIFIQKNDKLRIKIEISNPTITYPQIINDNREIKMLLPSECRRRNLTYDSPLTVNIKESFYNENDFLYKEQLHHKVVIAHLPIMIKSKYCNLKYEDNECQYDYGGYFIIKGKERILITQVRNNYNTPIVMYDDTYFCEVRSISDINGHSILIKIRGEKLLLSFSYLKSEVPIVYIFHIFGITDISQLSSYIICEETLEYIKKLFEEYTENAYEFISKCVKTESNNQTIEHIIFNEMFPHIGFFGTKDQKIIFLCRMVRNLVQCILKIRPLDEKDNLINKRFESSGTLIHDLFKQLFRKFLLSLDNNLYEIHNISQNNFITKKIQSCFLTGNWGAQLGGYMRSGVSQILGRKNYWESLSYLQRVSVPIIKETKNIEIRQIHSSQKMYLCPFETPEGLNCGIVMNLTFLTTISIKYPINILRNRIMRFKYYSSDFFNTIIYLNNIPIGSTQRPYEFIKEFKIKRRYDLDEFISINYEIEDEEIFIYSDEGRLIRPIINRKNKYDNKYNFDELLKNNIVEINDINELINFTSSFKNEKDYMEFSASAMYGIIGSLIPFSNHSPAPRNCYASAHRKQAISVYSSSGEERYDTITYKMHELQKPLIQTLSGKLFNFDKMPTGLNCIVAICNYMGLNQEDSIIIQRQSVERGLFKSSSFRCHQYEEKRQNNITHLFQIPDPKIRKLVYNYNLLDSNGIIKKGTKVSKNDVIVGRVSTIFKKDEENQISDSSLVIGKNEEGIIDLIDFSINGEGNNQVKIIIRQDKPIMVGEKLASICAQKSIISILANSWDMPFTSDGMVPDLIMSPLAFPSRMTINQILSMIIGRIRCEDPTFSDDCSPFTYQSTDKQSSTEILSLKLKELGFNPYGTQIMYDGMTGEQINSEIFIGPTYYQRLKHIVSEKIYARNKGPLNILTRQPTSGRSNLGGIKLGNMEIDALMAHGISSELISRITKCADEFYIYVCDICSHLSNDIGEYCKQCENGKYKKTLIPYISKLIFQELNAMGIKTQININ